ncbi:hypothetical protein ACSBPU_05605 [Parapusillimonas sp. JC17]|uniref:hypothetical protein n=1 Tax=Parapusillimonas sp. JC17 TaxID=3445768 RepID=UPI003F9F9339
MRITNLTNSPYDLLDAKGKTVRLAARGSVSIDPHPQHVSHYRAVGYFRIEDDAPAKPAARKTATQPAAPTGVAEKD